MEVNNNENNILYIRIIFDHENSKYKTIKTTTDYIIVKFFLNNTKVKLLDLDFTLPETIDDLLLMAEGKSILNIKTEREGLVIRSHDRKISFKAISNKFLLNEK